MKSGLQWYLSNLHCYVKFYQIYVDKLEKVGYFYQWSPKPAQAQQQEGIRTPVEIFQSGSVSFFFCSLNVSPYKSFPAPTYQRDGMPPIRD